MSEHHVRMRRLLVALMMLKTGCASVGLNRTALAVSTAALACDWAQTRHAASLGWRGGPTGIQYENNPIMGRAPSTSTVDLYFVGVIAASVVAWKLIPAKWRAVAPTAIVAAEARPIKNNLYSTGTVCGL